MTREQEILNKAIDYSEIEENFLEYDDCGDTCDDKEYIEKAFIEGAKWADKTMIDKACEWLDKNITNYESDMMGYIEYSQISDIIQDFRKAMEE